MKRINLILFSFLIYFASSQNTLSIEDAIKNALKNNYGLIISKNLIAIAKSQNNIGTAGMSPTVTLNGNLGLTTSNSRQEYLTGQIQERTGANSYSGNATLNAAWQLFDGFRMFAVKKRLGYNEHLTDIQLKQLMEVTTYSVILNYFDIVRLSNQIKAAEKNIEVYSELKNIATLKSNYGSGSNVDLLMALTEENKIKSDLIKLKQQLQTTKYNLNILMVAPSENDILPSDSIIINYQPKLDELKKTLAVSNSSVNISKQTELINQQSVKEAQSIYLPQVQFNLGLNEQFNRSQVGFMLFSKQLNLSPSLSAGWTLYSGGYNKKITEQRKLTLLNQQLTTKQFIFQVEGMAYLHYTLLQQNFEILKLEGENLKNATELLQLSVERYKNGKAALLETLQSQKYLEDIKVRYINVLYELKREETELLKANGKLIN
ncbi:MAG: TolC family protein [Bacteroidetes bacterium]|nr:TolC family protein [Bacteroidota bacterium]